MRLELAEEDAKNNTGIMHDVVSPGMLIHQGLELEEQQSVYSFVTRGAWSNLCRRRLKLDSAGLGLHSTDLQRAKMVERITGVRRRIEAWQEIQALYMPGVVRLRSRVDASGELEKPWDLDLLLPSEVLHVIPSTSATLVSCEWKLRLAQAHDILDELRSHLLLRSQLYNTKDRHIRGQKQGTRSTAVISALEDKIKADASRYRKARAALLILGKALSKVGWDLMLRELNDGDVRGLSELYNNKTQGTVVTSWIWRVESAGGDDKAMMGEGWCYYNARPAGVLMLAPALRLEWCKARARSSRWHEECRLLVEEMRRVLVYFSWDVARWVTRAKLASQEGHGGYAWRQAAVRTTMRDFCVTRWQSVPGDLTDREVLRVGDVESLKQVLL